MSPCSIDGCGSPAGLPGTIKTMCRAHYQRRQKYGDPLFVRVRQKICSIDGCDKTIKARTWCTKHLTRWKRYGSPTARMSGEIVDGKKICPRCHEDKDLAEFSSAWCRPCWAAYARDRRIGRPDPRRPKSAMTCDICGGAFQGDKRTSRFCSEQCRAEAKCNADAEYRALRRAVRTETVRRKVIFARDGYCCQLCGLPLDMSAMSPHPLSPSIDHRVPLSLGGEHSMANCQASHLRCNVSKGARV